MIAEIEPVKVLKADPVDGLSFLLYFSDDTTAEVSAREFAECFPDTTVPVRKT
ncbi:MAG: hypothetical protein WB439_11910 [Acidobacteriaceae bacterium]